MNDPSEVHSAEEPVRRVPGDEGRGPRHGTALCLSGGGYRAMLFHVGVLWRLNDAGMLPSLARVSSVSGGSITAAVVALHWQDLAFDDDGVGRDYVDRVVAPLRDLARTHVDVTSVLGGVLNPFRTVSDRVTKAYRTHLFGDATLQDLPDEPRFVINATNIESGVLMRFSRPYLADYRVGRIPDPAVPLATAVAASSAFPPFLSPCTVDLSDQAWTTDPGNDLTGPEYRNEIRLSDGGVYDNLGLETAWKAYDTILVSDAGGRMSPEPDPPGDWARHTLRVLQVIDNQVRSLRKRQVVEAFLRDERQGMYVGIRSDPEEYPVADRIPVEAAVAARLADTPTRLDRMPEQVQEELVNWGYAIADTGLRAYVRPDLATGRLPYPDHPLAEDRP